MGFRERLFGFEPHMRSAPRRRTGTARRVRRGRPLFESLEERLLLSAVLYVDYGDNFPDGGLNTTVGAINSTTSGSNPDIDGPTLSDSAGADYAAGTAVNIVRFNEAYPGGAAMRAEINQFVTRFYEPLDITVVDLTPTAQNVNGYSVAAASSLDDISVTLGLNEGDAENNDTYIIVGLFTIDPGGDNFNPADSDYGGLSTGTDIGGFNDNDGTALVLLVSGLFDDSDFLGPQVAHESGHAFGLRHTFGNDPDSHPNVDEGLHQSDLMSYLGYDTFGGFNFFTRYPMVRGDGNTDNDTLSAAGGALTPFDQMRIDPNIGPSGIEYVTGTGQNDIITIAKSGALATVSVQAFSDANYTTAVSVPGTGGGSTDFSYSIDLTKPLVVDAGARNDRIILDADLGIGITLRGMHGTDEVVVMGKNGASGSYVPGTNSSNGLDDNPDLRGSLVFGGTTIGFREFESASSVTVQDIASFTFQTPLPTDVLTFDSVAAGENRVTGTSGGVTIVPMSFFNVASLSIDTGTNDGGTGADTVTFTSDGIVAAGLQNLTVTTGAGADVLVLNLDTYSLPVLGGTFTYFGGGGSDEIRASANVDFTLSDTSLGIDGAGSIALSSVEEATLTGGAGENSFSVSDWTGQATLRGASGNDDYTVDFTGAGSGMVDVDDLSGAEDTLVVNGTTGDDTITAAAASVARGSETVTHSGIEELTVLGGAGDDDFFVTAAGAEGITLDGQGGSDDYTVDFGALAGIVTVADTPPAALFDRLFVNGTADAEVLLIAPAFVQRNGTERVNYSGIEQLHVNAGDGDDDITVDDTDPPTTVLGGDGDDEFLVLATGPNGLTLDGEEDSDSYAINLGSLLGPVVIADSGLVGIDTLLINGTPGDDVIILTDAGVSSGTEGISFSGIEMFAVDAGDGDDLVDGSALTLSVTIYGGNGDDTLIGGSNDDFLYGQNDDDDLIGNLGADYLDGGSGSDGLVGDMGTIVREILDGSTQTTLATPGGKLSALINQAGIRRVITLIDEQAGDADTLVGGDGNDYLHGGAGGDSLAGDAGNDALFGNLGDDALSGGDGSDHLYGGADSDLLDGGADADIAYGGDGDDTLMADSSADRLIDWFGNFNSFVGPGPGHGAPVIVRSPSPWLQDFVLLLAAADGASDPNAEIQAVIPGGPAQKGNSGK